jgi:hypothetical protein
MSRGMWMALGLWSGQAWAGTIYVVRPGDDMLLAFDTRTRTLNVVGPLGIDFDFGGMAWDARDGVMFMVGGRATPALYTVDINTGRATLVGRHNQTDIFSLAWDPNTDTLYGGQASQANGLWRLDQNTGAATFIGNPGIGMSGADWDHLDRGIIANAIATSDFYLIDPANAQATRLGSGGMFLNDGGLAYDPDTAMYYFFDWSGTINSFDPANGYMATPLVGGLASMDGASSADGFFAPPLRFLAVSGVCPGPQEFQVTDLTPGGDVVIMRGERLGDGSVPKGPCRGTALPVTRPRVIDRYVADDQGVIHFTGSSSSQHCGAVKMIALDLTSCDTSNLQTP